METAPRIGTRWPRACGAGGSGPPSGRPPGAEAGPGGDLDDVTVGVAQVDRAERAAVVHLGGRDVATAQVVAPGLLLLRAVDAQGEVVRGAGADEALGHLRVVQERDERAVVER